MTELQNLSATNCSESARYLYHNATTAISMLYPFVTCMGMICNGRLLAVIWKKRYVHPISNFLLMSTTLSSLILAVTCFTESLYRHWIPILTGDPCRSRSSALSCNASYTLIFYCVGIYQLSIAVLGIERAIVAGQTFMKMRELVRIQNSVERNVSNFDYSVFRRGSLLSTESLKHRSWATVAAVWIVNLLAHLARMSKYEHDTNRVYAYCTAKDGNFIVSVTISLAISLISILTLTATHVLSRHQLQSFLTTQVHFTLEERTNLRYNLHVTEMVGPVMLYSMIGHLMASVVYTVLIVAKYPSDPMHRSIIVLYTFLLFNYSPTVVFGVYCQRCFSNLTVTRERGLNSATAVTRADREISVNNATIWFSSQKSQATINPTTTVVEPCHTKAPLNHQGETHFNTLYAQWNYDPNKRE